MLTPFRDNGSINIPLFCSHANFTLENGTHGVTLFGTTGEGASIGLNERQEVISDILKSGIAAEEITLGLCGTAVGDVVSQVRQGIEFGVTKYLLLPPFYFKILDDNGLFEWHAQLFAAADPSAKFILYHIPQITQVPLSFDLIMRLKESFPDRVMAVKDSAGQWENTEPLLASGKVPILVGDERLLHKAAAIGAAGSICGMANLYPNRLRAIFETHIEDAEISSMVTLIVSAPVIPALKQAMVAMTGNSDWGRVRAPLQKLGTKASSEITARFTAKVDAS